jgi:hypothetical protein
VKFKLKIDGKVKYSNGEQAAFKALSVKPRSSTDVMKVVYSAKEAPYNGRKIVIGMLASLRKKMLANKEPFKLLSTERRGPWPIEFWLEGK